MNTITWSFKTFDKLGIKELYELLRLRTDIFVVEQECAYEELDGLDYKAVHQMAFDEAGELIAYSRIFPPGVVYKQAAIGRVAVKRSHRGKDLGNVLMSKAILYVAERFETPFVKISAQSMLENFYARLGFVKISEEYVLDGIPHIDMELNNID